MDHDMRPRLYWVLHVGPCTVETDVKIFPDKNIDLARFVIPSIEIGNAVKTFDAVAIVLKDNIEDGAEGVVKDTQR